MTEEQFAGLCKIRDEFRAYVDELSVRASPWLLPLQDEVRRLQGYSDYKVETPIVYNRSLDDVRAEDDIRFIIVADNPGKNEQLGKNQRYLVGQSGKLARGWFKAELGIDFEKQALIINKTPIHTPKTAELRLLRKIAGAHLNELDALLDESQKRMADFAFRMHGCLDCYLWISGYGELAGRGLFKPWAEALSGFYSNESERRKRKVLVFRHFSMNQFAIEYKSNQSGLPALERLEAIGLANRQRILGW
ncbi:MAG: hypothetical protein LWX00_04690 [Spirochaetia bacterium]|nr:hypothetical protein [Spirochaetia bacterium]